MARPKLTADQQRFVDEYLIDRNGTQAYRRAFPGTPYHSARVLSQRLLLKVAIRDELRAARRAQQQRTRVTADRVVREAARVAFSDVLDLFDADGRLRPMREIPLETRRAIASVKVKRTLERVPDRGAKRGGRAAVKLVPVEVVEVKLWDKGGGLDKLCRAMGLYKDQPALEVLLASLPADAAAVVRSALAAWAQPGAGAGGGGATAGG